MLCMVCEVIEPLSARLKDTKKPESLVSGYFSVKSTQTGTRTQDQLVKSQLLYQLSYLRFFVLDLLFVLRPFERGREIVINDPFGKIVFHLFSFSFFEWGRRVIETAKNRNSSDDLTTLVFNQTLLVLAGVISPDVYFQIGRNDELSFLSFL